MYDNIPDELRRLNQWVCWKGEPDPAREGKIKKLPINAKTGGGAMSNNPSTWCGFDEAVKASPKYSGIGFMFANGYFGVDLDGCDDAIADYKRGIFDNVVGEFIHTLASYSEYSVSGAGVHIICKGTLPPGGRRRGNVEMYDTARYFIVTGNQCADYDHIKDCTDTIKPLHEKYIGGGQAPTTGIIKAALPLNLSESEIIKLAEQSKQGQLFTDLYSGNYTTYYRSQSEADMALCNILAFWCGRDETMMDKLFRSSALMREKWDRKQGGSTYGAITLGKASRGCMTIYEPRPEYAIHIGTSAPDAQAPKKLYTLDDTGNAQRFLDRFGESALYNYDANKWMYWDGRRWDVDTMGEAKRMADEICEEIRHGLQYYLESLPPNTDADEMTKAYQRHVKSTRGSKAKESMLKEAWHLLKTNWEQFDTRKNLVNVINGTLNLITGELLPHSRAHMITKMSRCEYTDKADKPLWDKFLCEIFDNDTELIRYVQKAVGYSLSGSTEEHCAFFCYGTGRNGKSTFLDIISEILGDYAVNIQPETIMVRQAQGGPTSDIARLNGARFVTTVEPNEGARLNEGLLKQLTGGDRVTASRKYENEFEFEPEFKLWMGTNHKPTIRGTDVGIWSRIKLIPFNIQIPDDKMDKQLKYKLQQELPAILAWAVDGCLLWRREGLKVPESVRAASAEYRGEMDVLASFLENCCEDGGEVDAGDLFHAYLDWAKESNEYEMSSTKFGREMGKRYEKRRSGSSRIYIGVRPRKDDAQKGFRIVY